MYRFLVHIALFTFIPLSLFAQTEKMDSLRTHINFTSGELETIDQIAELTSALILTGQMEEAREWLLSGFQMAERMDSREGRFKILIKFGDLYINRQMADSANIMLEQAEFYASAPEELKELYHLRGNTFALNGRQILALEEYERAIFLADSLGDSRKVAGLNMNIGTVQSLLGKHTEALRAYYNALEFAELEKDSLMMALASNNVGWEFEKVDNNEQAEYFLLRSEKISRSINFTINLRRTLLNLANLYSQIGEYSRSEDYFNQSLGIANELDDTLGKIRVYYNLGIMEGRRGNIQEAERLLRFALDESAIFNNAEGEYRSASGLGDLEMSQGNYPQAIRWYARANQTADTLPNPQLRVESYEKLYHAYRQVGNLTESLRWLEERNQLNDSLQSSEQSRLLAEYETLFNLKRTEQQTEVLRAREQQARTQVALQRWFIIFAVGGALILLITAVILIRSNHKRQEVNEELKETNDQLSVMNKTVKDQNGELEKLNDIKNKLFAIIAHDLRGPLGSLQSLLYLIREHDLSESEMSEITTTLERNLQENASMMDNLLAWASAQMNGIQLNVRNFKLKQGVKSVTDQIVFQAEKKGVKLQIEIEEDIEVKADYDMIKLVTRNLIANAIKFSTHNDTITIKAVEKKKMVEVQVIDEGVGIKKEDQKKLFSKDHFTKRGTDNEKGSGLGLMLCKEFVEKHQGKFWFESKEGVGTTFFFTIPLADTEIDLSLDNEESVLENQK